jgi:hypothetical protein
METFNININIYNYLLNNKEFFIKYILTKKEFTNYLKKEKILTKLKFKNFENDSIGDNYLICNFFYNSRNTLSQTTIFLIHDKKEILIFEEFLFNFFKNILLKDINNIIRTIKIKAIK